MNTADHIASIREHLTALINHDNDAPRLVAEVVADFPSIVAAVSGPLGEEIERLENELSDAAKRRGKDRSRILRATVLLGLCIDRDIEDEDDED